ncbi:MAG: recombinase family protein [Nitrospirae bacterium]|nr:recombinase family protein [Nitrospirota bacterium]
MNYAYLRVSTDKQNLDSQLHEVISYCKSKGINISARNIFQEIVSTRKEKKDRLELSRLLKLVKQGDMVIVSELSRLGRDTIEVLQTVQKLLYQNIELRLIKENLLIDGADSITAKLIIPMLSAINELERDRISQRTKQALATKKAGGSILGRPKGTFSGSKLDAHLNTIKELLAKTVSVQSIAKIIGTSKQNLHSYIKLRKLKNNHEEEKQKSVRSTQKNCQAKPSSAE